MTLLRTYQSKIRLLRRSMRKYIPVIARRTGYTPGVITAYLDGCGSSEEKYKSIISAIMELDNELEQKHRQVMLEARRAAITAPVSATIRKSKF